MAQYIDKTAVVAEIEGRLKVLYKDRDFNYLQTKELEALLSFLDTLEVKEAKEDSVSDDLEEAANDYAHDLVHDDVFETFIAGAHWQALHSLETIKGMEEQAFLAGVEAEQTYKSFSKEELEELLNKWRKIYETE